jgi:hypothetical protein
MKVVLALFIYIGVAQAHTVSCPKLSQDFIAASDKAMTISGEVNCLELHKSIVLLHAIQTSCNANDAADAAELLAIIPQVYQLKCVK